MTPDRRQGRRTGQADGFTNSAYWLELVKLGDEGKDKQEGRSGGRCAGVHSQIKKVPIKK